MNAVTLGKNERRELMLPVHEFSSGKHVVSHWKNLKWNYREFMIIYDCLATEYLVGKYFLNRLLLLPAAQSRSAYGEENEQP